MDLQRFFVVSKWEGFTPPKINSMTMEKQQFEDISPIENCDFPVCHVSVPGSICN